MRYCAALGHHVILEGILFAKYYRPMLSLVIAGHHGPSHVFYVDVPLEETLRRHATRPLVADVPADKMRDWYVPGDTLGLPGETVLDGTADLDAMLDAIRARIGPVATAVTTGGTASSEHVLPRRHVLPCRDAGTRRGASLRRACALMSSKLTV